MARRPSLPDTLHSAAIKLKRANLHTQTAKREALRFLKSQPKPTFGIHREGEITLGETFDVWNVVKQGYPDPPETFSTRFGDAIHNYRCVLDHIAWQLVKHGSDPNPAQPRHVQFPIYDTAKDFRRNRARRLPGVARGPVDFIKARQSRPRWNHPENPLRLLANFSNDDKHRAAKVVVAALTRGEVHHTNEVDCEVVAGIVPSERPVFKPGAPIAGFRLRATGLDPKVRMYGSFEPCISLEDGGELVYILERIRDEVTEILYAPEITSAVV